MRERAGTAGRVVFALLLAASALLPAASDRLFPLLATVLWLSAGIQVWVLVRRRAGPDPWWLLAGGVALFATQISVQVVGLTEPLTHDSVPPAKILELAAYLAIVTGSGMIVRRRAGNKDWDGLIDGAIVGCAAAVVVWQWTTGLKPTGWGALATALPATLLAIVLGITVRLIFVAWQVPAARWLAATTLSSFAGNVVNLALGAEEGLAPVPVACWIGSQVFMVYGSLSPSRSQVARRAIHDPTMLRSRLTVLGLALAAIPVSTALRSTDGQLIPVVGTTIITGLALWRLGRLLHDREGRARHQGALLELGRLAAAGDRPALYTAVAAALHHALDTRATAVVETGRHPVVHSASGIWPDDLTPAEEGLLLPVPLPQPLEGAAGVGLRLRGVDYWQRPFGSPNKPSGVVAVAVTRGRDDQLTLDAAVQLLSTGVRRLDAEEQMRHASLHCSLTGLANRALMQGTLVAATARAHRSGTTFAVMFVDLDGFKSVNDSLGHPAGDELLILAAQRLLGCVRPSDTVARISGDEFVLIAERVDDNTVSVIAQRIVATMAEPFPVSAGIASVTASVGALVVPPAKIRAVDPDVALQQADALMYQVKRSGKANFALATLDGSTSLHEPVGDSRFSD